MPGSIATPGPKQIPRVNPYPTTKPRQLRHGDKSIVPRINANPSRPKAYVEKPIVGRGIIINVNA